MWLVAVLESAEAELFHLCSSPYGGSEVCLCVGDTEQVAARLLCSQCVGGSRGSRRWVECVSRALGLGAPSRGFGGRGRLLRRFSGPPQEGEQVSSVEPGL